MNRHADVPVIDISGLSGNDMDVKKDIAARIDRACRGSGFFYAANHGVDLAALQKFTTDWHMAMSPEEKWELAIRAYNPANPRNRNGYYMAVEGKKANESFCYLNPSFDADHATIKAGLPSHEVNIWPDEARHPGMRRFYEAYFSDVFDVAAVILRGFAIALGREESFFERHFSMDDTLSAVSLIRYPFLENYPPLKLGPDGEKLSFEHHQDVSLITVLYQTAIPNLQVETAEGYLDIPVSDEHFLVNCGTYMAHITNGYYPAPVHRVKYINAERLSIPFFANLSHASAIDPFAPPPYAPARGNPTVSYGDYLQHGLLDLIRANGQT
uniref:Isopenicillin N synthase n=1 Tax=Lysobacter lactamgenus TaxID=39596 RepID=IPNS_LYSLA|nr:RecName: Full=Isopenicillin N synthase; Short=IPNS [Lysobacter lactamgenus]CAA39983.1 isopenicillin N synthase [Lysobacter lactamgenus]